MSEKLTKIEQNVEWIYKTFPEALELHYKKRLIRFYWKYFDDIEFPMTEEDHEQSTPSSSIVRARRKIREKYGISDKKTKTEQQDYAEHYANKGL